MASRKKKRETELVRIELRCGDDTIILEAKDVSFYAHVQECEMCGEHGDVTISFDCPACNGHHIETIERW